MSPFEYKLPNFLAAHFVGMLQMEPQIRQHGEFLAAQRTRIPPDSVMYNLNVRLESFLVPLAIRTNTGPVLEGCRGCKFRVRSRRCDVICN